MSKPLPLLLALSLALSGCYSFEMARVSKRVGQDIERQTGADVGGAFSAGLGPVSLAAAQAGGWAFAPVSSRKIRKIGRHVASVEFSARSIHGFDGTLTEHPAYLRRYERGGWYPLVTVRDSAASAFVYLRERGRRQEITQMLLVVVEPDEIVTFKLSGDLSGMLRTAIEMGSDDTFESGILRDAIEATGLIGVDEPTPPEEAPEVDADP